MSAYWPSEPATQDAVYKFLLTSLFCTGAPLPQPLNSCLLGRRCQHAEVSCGHDSGHDLLVHKVLQGVPPTGSCHAAMLAMRLPDLHLRQFLGTLSAGE